MSDEDLLNLASEDYAASENAELDIDERNLVLQSSIAASLLVIARNSQTMHVEHHTNEGEPFFFAR